MIAISLIAGYVVTSRYISVLINLFRFFRMELNALKRCGVARLKLVDISKECDIDSDLWDTHSGPFCDQKLCCAAFLRRPFFLTTLAISSSPDTFLSRPWECWKAGLDFEEVAIVTFPRLIIEMRTKAMLAVLFLAALVAPVVADEVDDPILDLKDERSSLASRPSDFHW